jgi:small subunit ribosomal protein S7
MRRRQAKKHTILPDPKYKDVLVTKFVNNMMMHGKKSVAFKIFYDAMDLVQAKAEEESPVDVWKKSFNECDPWCRGKK